MAGNYSRIQVNLLPPELQPGPPVRYGLVFNIILIAGTLTFILVHSFTSLSRISTYREQNVELQKNIDSLKPNEEYYTNLKNIEEKVNSYGRLISLASVDYVEMPVLMERVSRVLPDGVYLRAVANDRPEEQSNFVVLRFDLTASRNDPRLLEATLAAFKKDEYFNDCYMANAEYHQEGIQDRLPEFGINWNASQKRDDAPQLMADLIEFQIQARVKRPLSTEQLPRSYDASSTLTSIEFKTYVPPAKEEKKGKKSKEERRKEEEEAAHSGGLPPSATSEDAGGGK